MSSIWQALGVVSAERAAPSGEGRGRKANPEYVVLAEAIVGGRQEISGWLRGKEKRHGIYVPFNGDFLVPRDSAESIARAINQRHKSMYATADDPAVLLLSKNEDQREQLGIDPHDPKLTVRTRIATRDGSERSKPAYALLMVSRIAD